MPKRAPARTHLVTRDGDEITVYTRDIEALRWAEGVCFVGFGLDVLGTDHTVELAMDLPAYNALVVDWALSAPGRTRGLQFAIRAHARAGRLTGAETWPRNKP